MNENVGSFQVWVKNLAPVQISHPPHVHDPYGPYFCERWALVVLLLHPRIDELA